MKPTLRKPMGIIAILMIIAIWSVIVINVADGIVGWPILLQMVFYLVAGIVWVFPVRPILTWMETGKFGQ
ncbi:DUF2842 domain-containing protein [Alterisphingorhabdus coralli]|uniref:DUF2842 domain-containing protein n=1 Tax=Alterisphingorhabdus coralli TaxID=3071408 RepID=A0AA97F4J1_9SPHN|nr:DUF2842 domain-containing protein [Parasphingorhabdus sp. SCSIO 66989]WOE73903.1 DUF2842 domain-containing protein [Parasphingorhabdus sp. SCSIO 66989]